jgi:hypothetical protein
MNPLTPIENKIPLFYLNDPLCFQTVYDYAVDHSLRYFQNTIKKHTDCQFSLYYKD